MIAMLATVMGFVRQSTEDRLGLNYVAPKIPADLERFFTPDPNQKAVELLQDGETQIDMHEYYLGNHRAGWDNAISEHRLKMNRQFNSLQDVYGGWQAMQIGCDAFWIGYDDAYSQIDAATEDSR